MTPSKRRRILCIIVGLIATVLLATAVVWYRFSSQSFEPRQFLAHVVQLEQSKPDPGSLQALGWSLAILGRDDEVRQLDFFPQFNRPPSKFDAGKLELSVVPFREGIGRIAAEQRIIMIMEDHCASKHRELIGAALPACRAAGFTHYAAEAISQLDTALAQRGYPTSRTGLYTSDPKFGNVLRGALELNFVVQGYDYRPFTPSGREEFAAEELAKIFQQNRDARLLVHAGHAHVLKHETTLGERWLAARLWEKTGIEPFTIWQWSSSHDAHDYAAIVRALKDRGEAFDEPLLLMPPPAFDCGLNDAPYGLGTVDAIVIHPPDDSRAPAERTVLFPGEMQQVSGLWKGARWPVVVCAYKDGEPVAAVPLDQVMLRDRETSFALWIPMGTSYVIRVFDRRGLLNSHLQREGDRLSVSLESGS